MPTINKKCRRKWEPKPKPKERNQTTDPFYVSVAWRTLRKYFFADAENRLCVMCAAEGIDTVATVADHIIPIRLGGEPLDVNNLQGLCDRCHAIKSAKERGL